VLGLKSGEARKQIRLEGHGVGPYYVGAVQAGPYVFAAGEVPVHAPAGERPRVIGRADDLPEHLRLMNFGRVHAEYPLMAQAAYVYELIAEALQSYGCGVRDVLHQTVYLVEPAHFPALENVAAMYFGTRMPPTTLVPIRGASPFREALLEIEVTALVP
jgi:enamine deaminase RidA (YjgF/YER057c/UK114 family)